MRMRRLLGAVAALSALALSTPALPQAVTRSGSVEGGSDNFFWGMYQIGVQNGRPVLVPRMVITDTSGTPITNFSGGGGSGGSSGPVGTAGTNNGTAAYVQGVTGGVPIPISGSFLQDSTFTGRIPVNGQKAKSGSIPVTLASDEDIKALQTAANASLASIDSKLPALSGGKLPTIGDLQVAGAPNSPSNPAFVSVSGTVTANLGTLNGAATDSTLQSIRTLLGSPMQQTGGSVGITGGLPGFYSTPTFNLGTLNGAALDTSLQAIKTALGTPMQQTGGTVGLTGTLPPFSATPTFNLGTLNGAATAAGQSAQQGSVAPGTAALSSVLSGCLYNSTPVTLANGQQASCQFDANGYLRVAVMSGGGGSGSTGSVGAAGVNGTQAQSMQGILGGVPFPVLPPDNFVPAGSPFSASAAATLFTTDTTGYGSIVVQVTGTWSGTIVYEETVDGTNWFGVGGTLAASNGGAAPATSDASPQTRVFPVLGKSFRARVSAYASGTFVANPVLRMAPPPISSVYIGAIVAGGNTIGGFTGSASASAVGGIQLSTRLPTSANTTNLTQSKATAGRVYKVVACNNTTSIVWIKFYNALAVNVSVGVTTPVMYRPIPPAATAGIPNCSSADWSDVGFGFTTAISWALTTGVADNDNTAPANQAILGLSVEYN